jgi:hypothetical protein
LVEFRLQISIPLFLKALAEAGDPRAAWIIGLTYYMKYVSDRKEGKGFCLYFLVELGISDPCFARFPCFYNTRYVTHEFYEGDVA